MAVWLFKHSLYSSNTYRIYEHAANSVWRSPHRPYDQKGYRKKLNSTLDMPIRLQINNRVYTYYYRDIGVYLDAKEALKEIFLPNTKRFPINILEFIKSFLFREP